MKRFSTVGTLTLLLIAMLPGCGVGSLSSAFGKDVMRDSAGEVVVDAAGKPASYTLFSTGAITPTAVTASTVENAAHPASYATDGNVNTAWAPLYNDAAPALTFEFGEAMGLTSVKLRTSPAGVKVAVKIWSGGGWVTIASGLAPTANVTTVYPLAALPTTKARLCFSGVHPALLYVCEASFQGASQACPEPPK